MDQSTRELRRSCRTSAAARARIAGWLLAGSLTAHLAPANAQFKLQETFTGATAPGWTLSGNALLTAPSIDPVGQGWLRLTDIGNNEKGLALDTAQTFAGNVPVTIRFSYVSWGGSGADGIAVFLYDSTQNMSGATTGGGLGYCGGTGGYLAIGLDEYGNFSNPGDHCGAAGGGPGLTPDSLVIRGPLTANDQYITGVPISGGIDNPGAAARPSPKTVIVTLTPAAMGYTVTAQFQSGSGQPFQTLFSNVSFPYTAPSSLSVGFSGSTGGSTNYHELQGLVTATPDDLQVTLSGPATVLQGTPVTYTLTVVNNGANPIDAMDAPLVTDTLPAPITGATWTCVPAGGATCTASGSGNLNTSGLTLPSNASVTYTISGTLDPAVICGSTVTNSASADFGSASTFVDPDETNNTASVNSAVSCAVTLVANPGMVSFGPQTVGTPSGAQTVTLTGTNGAQITSITTTGDFAQTNDCSAALSGTSCTIQVTFTPGSEGSLSGTLVVTSTASPSPMTVALTGTGTNAVPDPFHFNPLNNVDPSSLQVSNPITVSGTNVPTTISVSNGAAYSINGGPYTAAPGIVPPGAQVTVEVTASSSYGSSVTVVLSIGGVNSSFVVTTKPQPQLQNVAVTSGGGGLSAGVLLALGLLLLLRLRRIRVDVAAAVLVAIATLLGPAAGAATWDELRSNLYLGGALGDVTSTLTASKITDRLASEGYQVVASDLERSSLSGSLYAGYELPGHFALEFGWSYLGRTRAQLRGVEPPSFEQLLYDASRVTRGGGDAWSLTGRYRLTLGPKLSLDLRAGPYRWVTHSDLWLGSLEQLSRNDRGWGYVVGVGPRYQLSARWCVGVNANYFASTADNRFAQVSASLDYRLP